jgi:hypothetical protein
MKSALIFGLLSISFSLNAFAAEDTKCELYNPPNDPQEMAREGQTSKYAASGFLVELKSSMGCAESCWNSREILVTRNGVTVSTAADAKTLEIEKNVLMYPTLRFLENGNKYSVQCITTLN